jgi:hypothetical protein
MLESTAGSVATSVNKVVAGLYTVLPDDLVNI